MVSGTTTATILARAIYTEGCRAVAAGMNPMDLARGISAAVEEVTRFLDRIKRNISKTEEVEQVATISANSDREIGSLIAKAMEKVGKDGVITVQDGKTLRDEIEIIEGMKFDQGYVSAYFVTDAKTQRCELEDVHILITDKKISSIQSILGLLEQVAHKQLRFAIIAENVEGEALTTLILNKLRGNLQAVAVKAPGFGENRKANLQDIATLTGGQVISEDVGMKLESVTLDQLGRCKKLIVSKDDTIILDGAGGRDAVRERCEMIREAIEKTTSEYDREKLQERLAKLSGGVAVLRVGGASEVEVSEKKDRITDALNATKAAVEQGIVPGGGVALLYASKELEALESRLAKTNFDQSVGVKIVKEALKMPCRTIAQNAGVEGAVIVGKLLESTDVARGYDAQTGRYVDMFEAGIIDPTKVVRTALQDAASVAALMTTAEAVIVEAPKEEGGNSGSRFGGAPSYMD
jgi:chaperonin GroEL